MPRPKYAGTVSCRGMCRFRRLSNTVMGCPTRTMMYSEITLAFPKSALFSNFLSADARVFEDIKMDPKYAVRPSVTGHNLPKHFRTPDVDANFDDLAFGVFLKDYQRQFRADSGAVL